MKSALESEGDENISWAAQQQQTMSKNSVCYNISASTLS